MWTVGIHRGIADKLVKRSPANDLAKSRRARGSHPPLANMDRGLMASPEPVDLGVRARQR